MIELAHDNNCTIKNNTHSIRYLSVLAHSLFEKLIVI